MAEAGHQPNRVFIDQDGNFNLNGAAFKNDADVDISAGLETALGGSSGGQKLVGGTITNSTTGLASVATGLSGIIAAWANPVGTAASTAAGVPSRCKVGFATNSGTLEVLALKNSATAQDELVATSSSFAISWAALGYV